MWSMVFIYENTTNLRLTSAALGGGEKKSMTKVLSYYAKSKIN